MSRRWRDPSAFRADPAAVPAPRPNRRQSLMLLLVLVLAAGAAVAASYLISPDRARAFDLLHGSVFIGDNRAPVAIDLASAKPTVRIGGGGDAISTVGASDPAELGVLPLSSGTLLLNTTTGEFNLIDNTGFVVKHDGGVPVPPRPGATTSVGIAADDFAYIEETGASGTSVYLVTRATVLSSAAGLAAKPRGFISMKQPGSTAPGSATSPSRRAPDLGPQPLWLLVSGPGGRVVRQLTVPPNSSPGAALHKTDYGSVTGPAALGSSSGGPAATGTVGLAQPGSIKLFWGSKHRTVDFTAPPGVDRILPASNQDGRLSFLLHGTTGWSVVSVNPDGSGLRRPVLTSLPATAALVEPAESSGALYTADSGSGAVYRVDAAGAGSKVADYPLAEVNGTVIEPDPEYSRIYVIARESRVIVDSPPGQEALAIFTDGSRKMVPIQKSAGVSVSAAGGAEELAKSHTKKPKPPVTGTPTPPPPKTGTPPRTPPNTNQLRCTKTGQQPHIPQDLQGTSKSRSVVLSWTYPILDREDCVPRTYRVNVTLLSTGAPEPPGTVDVPDGATAVNITDLFPLSRYSLTVTAYIGRESATSAALTIQTGPEGPAAPLGVKVAANGTGGWDLAWSSCGSVDQHCVPVQTWDVLPSFCDGLGGGLLSTVTIPADSSTKRQAPYTYTHAGILGRGLSFQIEAVGADGSTSDPSPSTPCVTSWSPPVASALTLSASQPPDTAPGGTTTTTVDLGLGHDASVDVGGIGATISLSLTDPAGTTQTKKITYDGRSAQLSAAFGGITAGAQYSATATVTPPGPAGHSVTLPSVPVIARSNWPAGLSATARCPRSGLGLTCDLTVTISGLKSADAKGEKFDLTTDSRLQCGTVTRQLSLTDFDPAQARVTLDNVSQLNQLIGQCQVFLGLVENAGSKHPLYFGGTVSPTFSTGINLGSAARANLGPNDIDVAWGDTAFVKVSAHDADAQTRIDSLTESWTEEVDAPDGTVCGTSSPSAPQDLNVATSCVNQHGGDAGSWVVTLTYTDKIDHKVETLPPYRLSGPVPGYQPCTPAGFTAAWGATIADGVTVGYLGTDPNVLAGCGKWQYTLLDPTGGSCGNASGAPSTSDGTAAQIALTCATPPSIGWKVEVDYQDTAGDDQTIDVDVGGTPPET